jgi:hypothetical protein
MTFGDGGLSMVLWWMIPKNGHAMEKKRSIVRRAKYLFFGVTEF